MRSTTMILILSGLFASAMLVAMPAQADVAAGQKLHEAKCSSCHATPHTAEFYTSRVGKNYKTRDSLRTMVQACANHFNIDWFDEDVDAVTAYLNQSYYKYKK